MTSTFSSKFASDLIAFASKHGADSRVLTELLDVQPMYLNREDIRIPCATIAALWDEAIRQTGDPALGLHMGRAAMYAAHRTTSLIMESSATVLEAFELAVEYSVLIADAMTVVIGDSGDDFFLEFTPRADWLAQPPNVVEDCFNLTIVSTLNAVQRMTGVRHAPSLLTFCYPRPRHVAEYYAIFDCPIVFGASATRLGFPKALARARVATANRGLRAVVAQYADDVRASFQQHASVTQSVLARILDSMSPAPPTLGDVAQALGTSERSLQRRLKDEGQTFRRLVERVRMELAQRYLLGATYSVDEVSYLSGYADTASFVRAFKRVYGVPPRRFADERQATT